MRFSVVIPTYNRAHTLRQCLAALVRQDYADYEVIVVDDGSRDGTAAMVKAEFPNVTYLQQDNRGPAAARNLGIAAAKGEVVAFTDDDCLPPPDWLARLADGYARYPHVAGVGGSLRAPPELLRHNAFAQYERYVAVDVYHAGAAEVVAGFECPGGGANNISYRRAVLDEVGRFDVRFPVAAGEDTDLKLRVCQRGYQLLYLPVWMTHLQDYTWPRFRRQYYVRGVGRNYFEALHGPGAPSRLKVALRALRRLLNFPRDLIVMRPRRLALVKLADGLLQCQGQWAGR